MSTATMTFEEIRTHAESIANDEAHDVSTMSPGDCWAQGDVGIVCMEAVPKNSTLDPNLQAQLAPGNTQGSRHCLSSLEGLKLYRAPMATPLDGPIIDAPKGCTVEHPEHGNVTLPPGVYGVVYQRQFDAQELRRVAD